MVQVKRGLAGLMLAGILAIPASGGTPITQQQDPAVLEAQLRTCEEELLFDLSNLPPPQERHQVFIHYEMTEHLETEPFRKHETRILSGVQELYANHGIDIQFLRYLPFRPAPDHLLLRVIDEDLYRTTIKEHPFIRIFSSGYADVDRRTAYVKGWQSDLRYERQRTEDFVSVSIDTVAHEIGHLLMLPHTEPEMLDKNTKNLMWRKTISVEGCTGLCTGITEEEARIIHSYLDKGQIYKAYEAAGEFTPYVERINQARMTAARDAKRAAQ